MSILSKIVTAVRGGAREAGEAVVDANALRILNQELHDARNAIQNAERGLASLVADHELAKNKQQTLRTKIEEHETYARKALQKQDETLARDIAERIGQFLEELNYQTAVVQDLSTKIAEQKEYLKEAKRKVDSLEREAKMVRTTEEVQRTTAALSNSFNTSQSRVGRAAESLKRIKERQERRAAEMKASEQLTRESSGADLDQRLKDAGIKSGNEKADDILARLRQQTQLPPEMY